MITPNKLHDLSIKIKEIAKNSPVEDTSKNINALFKSALTKMELVTREEFDIQSKVLIKTQAQLKLLEAKIQALEAFLDSSTIQKNS